MHALSFKLVKIVAGMLFVGLMAVDLPGAERPGDRKEMFLQPLEKMLHQYPQQKVFIHLDKEEYLAGESIWLKAYVVDAATHKPDNMSTNLYVELVNTKGELASIDLMRLENGVSHGDIWLPDSISEGNYELRAYTDWMHNFDKDFFFSKDIYVYNAIEENFIRRLDVWKNRLFNRRLSREKDNMQFAFFPEGGQLVAGLENRVAFKAANELGSGVEATGIIFDRSGNTVAAFSTEHNGMGSVTFIPEKGVSYRARVSFENGDEKRLRLPGVSDAGYVLSVQQMNDSIYVQVESNFDFGNHGLSDEIVLLAHIRGQPFYFYEGSLNDQRFKATIPATSLPTGICQVKLFSPDGNPIAERLVFVNRNNIQEAVFLESEQVTGDQSPDSLSVVLGLNNDDVKGSYSLAVIDTEAAEPGFRSNIASELLLFSDLKYRVRDPWFYLGSTDEEASRAVDLVMMTHGWRRFDWNKLINENYPEIAYGFPKGINIAGTVSPRASERKTGQVDVELAIYQDEVDIYTTRTDTDGNFAFQNLDYEGYFTARLRLEMRYERRSLRVDLAGRDLSRFEYSKNFNTRPLQVTSRGDDWERVPRPETTVKRRDLFEPGKDVLSIYSDPDQIIYFEDIRDQYHSIIDVLRTRVRGLRVVGNQITLRGPSSVMMSNEPLYLIDEVVVTRNAFLNVSVKDVEMMTVISGPNAAILGSRGANGALLIYTRRGAEHRHGQYEYLMKGFHIPSETFESKIHTDLYANTGLDRTLFWDPEAKTNEYGELTAIFPVDKHVRNILLILQGLDENGQITFSTKVINRQPGE